ncbi:hypothetical protein PR002_g4754 [Phytophthora rubi]|uniref:Uncharacterized protein n=1 Tax=Phytophthora rubi TaxID=129364 RepID=A0A6A3NHQ1_9STRA|nr:hypothetical protein PR002_g4754 [Phytophthora rubi]
MSGKKQIKVAAGLGLEEPGPNSPDHSSQNNRNLPEQHQPAKSDLVIRKLLNFGRKLAAGYNKLQISHRGMYSIERLHAYQAYCDKTSTVRAIAVCVLTPVPSLLAIVLIECFPLRDPLLGWEANYMFWIRFYISGVLICIGLTYQATDMVDRVKISLLQRLVMSIVAMSIYVGTVMLVSYLWIFPYHALVEYVECAVPILFGVYLTILYQLPVHEYYPHTRDLEAGQLEGMLMSLSVYVTLEVLSFVGMHMALKRKFHLSALYQLAFVLETHVVQLQSRMFVWIVFILQFTLAHYGVDFTFQFAWLH